MVTGDWIERQGGHGRIKQSGIELAERECGHLGDGRLVGNELDQHVVHRLEVALGPRISRRIAGGDSVAELGCAASNDDVIVGEARLQSGPIELFETMKTTQRRGSNVSLWGAEPLNYKGKVVVVAGQRDICSVWVVRHVGVVDRSAIWNAGRAARDVWSRDGIPHPEAHARRTYVSNHMVIYRGPDGKPGYHQTEDVHDAVGFVEQLRNDQGVEHARIFRLEELSFSYRPYFRVELQGGAPAVEPASATPAVAAAPTEAVADAAPATSGSSSSDADDSSSDSGDTSTETAAAPSVTETVTAATDTSAPTITSPSSGGDNGVGARRGLFGR